MKILYTIGHSNHRLEEFLQLLNIYKINQLIDIRTLPKSRHVPWFNKSNLESELAKINIKYYHLKELGGLRHTTQTSINKGWYNLSFRGYADYMQTPDFFAGLKKLMLLSKNKGRTAIMCAEALPFRCHRSLVADALVIRGWKILDIMSKTSKKIHKLTAFAKVDRSKRPIKMTYPKI